MPSRGRLLGEQYVIDGHKRSAYAEARRDRRSEREEQVQQRLGTMAEQFAAADYAVLLSSLEFLLPPGRVERLLKLAEEQGIPIPDDLA
jgi:hypothetical protein